MPSSHLRGYAQPTPPPALVHLTRVRLLHVINNVSKAEKKVKKEKDPDAPKRPLCAALGPSHFPRCSGEQIDQRVRGCLRIVPDIGSESG